MRKIMGMVLALGLVGGLVVGCGTNEKTVVSKLESHAQSLDTSNYKSTATMTVQMGDSSQSYYVETWYDSQDQYRIALGDASKHIHQYIIHNKNGMFVVSPSLGKVFRFNGHWADNQGHIYLYDQILQQIIGGKNVKVSKSGGDYAFELAVQPANDIVTTERVQIDAKTLNPETVTLLDKDAHAVVTLTFNSFQQNVQFTANDFNPQSILGTAGNATKPTLASDTAPFGYVEPVADMYGDSLKTRIDESDTDAILRYTGAHGFTLEEWRPNPGVDGFANGTLVVDMFGVPGVYSGTDAAHQLTWLNNDVEFSLISNSLSLDQMKDIAMTTFSQIGK